MTHDSRSTSTAGPSRVPLFSLGATALIALLWGAPFVVRTLSDLQPYPALLFPAGAYEVPFVGDRVLFSHYELYARGPSGLKRLDPAGLLRPLHAHYVFDFARRGFGQNTVATQDIELKRSRRIEVPRHVATPAEREEVLRWFAGRVREQAPGARQLLIRLKGVQFDWPSRSIAESSVQSEQVLELP